METKLLPLVFSGGFPKSLYDLSVVQLERFLVYIWAYTKTAEHIRILPKIKNRRDRVKALRQLICAVYQRLGLSKLLYTSEGLAHTKGSHIYYEIDEKKKNIIIWNRKNRTEIARIPASNVCYDAFAGNFETPKRKCQMKTNLKIKKMGSAVYPVIEKNKGSASIPVKKKSMGAEGYPVIEKVWSMPVVNIPDSDPEDSDSDVQEVTEEIKESIEISDSEEPENNQRELFKRNGIKIVGRNGEKRRLIRQDKGDGRVPFINNSITVSRVYPLVVNEDVGCSSSPEPSTLVSIEDYDEITISDSEDADEQEPPHRKVTDRLEEEIVISDSEDAVDLENKNEFLYRLGLCEPTNLPDDPIILPVRVKSDFIKFHRLPLSMVPLLVQHSLIDRRAMEPGPIGQDSSFVSTNKKFVSDNITKAKRTTVRRFNRYKILNLENCSNYHFPKKHYRSCLPVPLPRKRRHRDSQQPVMCTIGLKNMSIEVRNIPLMLNPVVVLKRLDNKTYLKYFTKQ